MSERVQSFFAEITIPQQKTDDDDQTLFPAVLSPSTDADVSVFTAAIRTHKPWLESILRKTGAVLLRGFPVRTASEFNDVVEAFGYEEMLYLGGVAPRSHVVGRVYTASELSPDHELAFHHEMAYVSKFPSKVFFFCEVEPRKDGETPIVLSHIVYKRMKDKYPEFVDKLEEKGLVYTNILGEDYDPTSPVGLGWKSSFSTSDKSVAEERAAKLGMNLEWLEDGVKTVTSPAFPAIKVDESRNRKIWFNNMVTAYIALKNKHTDFYKSVVYGDGTPLPDEILYDCLKIMNEESVVIPWKKGDVLLLDNLVVLYARRAFYPPRRVLTSLCKAAKLGMNLEWLEDGVKAVTSLAIPAIKVDESRNRKIWFNNMVTAYIALKDKHTDFYNFVVYGDGTPLPDEILYDCLKIMNEESVVIL